MSTPYEHEELAQLQTDVTELIENPESSTETVAAAINMMQADVQTQLRLLTDSSDPLEAATAAEQLKRSEETVARGQQRVQPPLRKAA